MESTIDKRVRLLELVGRTGVVPKAKVVGVGAARIEQRAVAGEICRDVEGAEAKVLESNVGNTQHLVGDIRGTESGGVCGVSVAILNNCGNGLVGGDQRVVEEIVPEGPGTGDPR